VIVIDFPGSGEAREDEAVFSERKAHEGTVVGELFFEGKFPQAEWVFDYF
jgi:hypothetical protein